MDRRRVLSQVALLFLALGSWQIASAGWIHAKAVLAQRLIASAWSKADAAGKVPRPWPGADLRPVARLRVASRGVDLYVLDNASPRALAFGPAVAVGNANPASSEGAVLVAHRDTHFAFLARLVVGDEIVLEGPRGSAGRYRVNSVAIMHRSDARVLGDEGSRHLTLVTCYPFDAVMPGTALRYVVAAERIEAAQESMNAS